MGTAIKKYARESNLNIDKLKNILKRRFMHFVICDRYSPDPDDALAMVPYTKATASFQLASSPAILINYQQYQIGGGSC